MDWSKKLQEPTFWLLAIATAIAVLHLTLTSRIEESDIFATSLLFWFAAGTLVWDHRHQFDFHSGLLPSIVGATILIFGLTRLTLSPDSASMAWGFPIIATLGLGLLASGFQGLRQYWKPLLIFGILALQPILILTLQAIDLSELTAKAASFNLTYLGFQPQRQTTYIYLPASRTQVYGACSGLESILQLLSISILFLLLFPLRKLWQRGVCVIAAVLIAFFVNSFRVALMAILNNMGNKPAFDFWHEGQGSLIFSAIAVAIFGGFCWLAFLRTPAPKTDLKDHA